MSKIGKKNIKIPKDASIKIDGGNLTANRPGHQIYGTIRIKDEIKKDDLTLIPSGRFDIGHTILQSYKAVSYTHLTLPTKA